MPLTPVNWVGLGLGALGGLSSVFGAKSAQDRMREAASRAMQTLDIPFYQRGEKLGKKFSEWLASKYQGQPTSTFQAYSALAASPMGQALTSRTLANPYAGVALPAQEEAWNTYGKRANTYEGMNLGQLALSGLLGEQARRAAFNEWKNAQMTNILSGAAQNAQGLSALYGNALGALGGFVGQSLFNYFNKPLTQSTQASPGEIDNPYLRPYQPEPGYYYG